MADENTNIQQADTTPHAAPAADSRMGAPASAGKPGFSGRGNRDRRGGGGRGRGGPRRGGDERRSEFAQKLIGIRRVARVMAGGRRFNFSAALVIGDKKGRVGVGQGGSEQQEPECGERDRAYVSHVPMISFFPRWISG